MSHDSWHLKILKSHVFKTIIARFFFVRNPDITFNAKKMCPKMIHKAGILDKKERVARNTSTCFFMSRFLTFFLFLLVRNGTLINCISDNKERATDACYDRDGTFLGRQKNYNIF